MIGWTHICLSTLIQRRFGQDVLEDILKKAGFVSADEFGVQTYYDDADTFRLFRVAAGVVGVSVDQIWEMYGDFLVSYACETGWEKVLTCMASNLQDFLDNLNSMHYFIDQIAFKSEMRGPTFKCEPQSDGSLRLHYYSNRQGLYYICKGLVARAARVLFEMDVIVNVVERNQESRKSGMVDHVIFSIFPDENHQMGKRLAYKFRKDAKNIDIIVTDNDAMPKLPVSLRDFNRIFPYHICFNKQMIIEHVGLHLLNDFGLADKKALKLTDLVQIVQPSDIQLTFKNIVANVNTLFFFQMKLQSKRNEDNLSKGTGALAQPLCLKGQMMMLSGGNSIIYICSPHATTVRDILNVNLYISDMPMHDATRDLVMLNQSRICQMELNKRLEETSKKMKGFAEELERKKGQTDHLLFEFVPVQIAEALRQHKPVEAQVFTEATVLVSDLPDFLSICIHTSPSDMIHLLSDLFHRFDRLIEITKVYKVLSLMDSYLVVGGVPNARDDHCEAILNLALGMVFEARQVTVPKLDLPIRLRVGVMYGPIVAGVVSEKKPRYCVLGDTVVTAKNICSQCDSGKVLVGNAVRSKVTKSLRSVFVFTSKGYIDTGAHKTLTHFLERNEKMSAWDIVAREKGAEQSIDGYKELHSDHGGEQWETVKQEALRQQQKEESKGQLIEVIDAMKTSRSQTNKALDRLISFKKSWRFKSNRSNDSGISVNSHDKNSQDKNSQDKNNSATDSAVCSVS